MALRKTPTVVICGGGIMGLSAAYNLSRNCKVILLEKSLIGSGASGIGPGVISAIRNMTVESRIIQKSVSQYEDLHREGHDIGYVKTGTVWLARTRDRLYQYQRLHSKFRPYLKLAMLSKQETRKLHPYLHTADLSGAFHVPGDCCVDPVKLMKVYAGLAQQNGVLIQENCGLSEVHVSGDKKYIQGVSTDHGEYIECDYFVNAAGQWSGQVASLVDGVKIAQHPVQHVTLVTSPLVESNSTDNQLPIVRDYDGRIYFWVDRRGRLRASGFEDEALPISDLRALHDRATHLDWDRFGSLLKELVFRVPVIGQKTIDKLQVSTECFTPDAQWIYGTPSVLQNYYVATGFCGAGIAAASGLAQILTREIEGKDSRLDLWKIDCQRFVPHHSNPRFLQNVVRESKGWTCWKYLYIDIPCAVRGMRTTPLYTAQKQAGAKFFVQNAFERPMWFDAHRDSAADSRSDYQLTWNKPRWFNAVKNEYWSLRQDVALVDMSAFTKIEVRSPGDQVLNYLQRISSNEMDKEVGTVIHTGFLNEHGGFENDCTVYRTAPNTFLINSIPAQHSRVQNYLQSQLPSDGSVQLRDVTSMYTALNVVGPDAEDMLRDVTDESLSKNDFPAMTCKFLNVGQASDVLAVRLTHSGEDGFMLYIPNEYALHVHQSLMCGREYGIRQAGYHALRSLRIERFFLYWGSDLGYTTTPLECGREFRVNFHKNFIGKDALLRQKETGLYKRSVQLVLDANHFSPHYDIWPWGDEPVFRNGVFVGKTTSCGFGFSLDRMVCLAIVYDLTIKSDGTSVKRPVTVEYLSSGQYHVEVAGRKFPCQLLLYAPKLKSPEQLMHTQHL